jgi:hypothetical protein
MPWNCINGMAKFPPRILDICASRSVVSLTFRPFWFQRNYYCHNSVGPSINLDVVVKRKIPAHAWHWIPVTPFVNNHVIVVFYLFGDSSASASYVPTFRNTLFHIHRWCELTPPMKMELTQYSETHHLWRWNWQCSETSVYKMQAPGNHPKGRIQ